LPRWWGRRALELAAWCCGTAAAELVAGFVLHRRVDSLPLPVEPLPNVVRRNRWPAAPRALSHRAAASGVRFGANDRASWLVLCAGASGRRGPCTGRGGRGAGCRRVPRAGNPFALVLRSARPRRRSPARLPGRPETSPTAFQTVRAVSPPRPTAIGKTSSPAQPVMPRTSNITSLAFRTRLRVYTVILNVFFATPDKKASFRRSDLCDRLRFFPCFT